MKKLILFSTAIILALFSSAQNISTFAGNGTAGYSGDGGQASSAELYNPYGLCVDASGNIYVADDLNQCIRKISPSGIINTIAGNGTAGYSGDGGQATNAELNNPNGIAIDTSGNIYIADFYNNCIRKVTKTGIISTFAGNGIAGFSGDGGQASSAELSAPQGIAVDTSGNVYIADQNQRIRKVSPAGIISTIAGNGATGYSGDGGQATAAEINVPNGLAVDALGDIYIADEHNNVVRKITKSSGIISTFAGNGTAGYNGDGGQATAAELNNLYDVALDKSGNLYIADINNNCIRKVSTAGIINTIAGIGIQGYSGDGGAATIAELYNPIDVVLDASGNIYIADAGNNRIREVNGLALGIMDIDKSSNVVMAFPNPANEQITFQVPSQSGYATIFDLTGRKITDVELKPNRTVLMLSGYANGLYLYRIIDKAGNLLGSGRFCVEK